MSARSVVMGLNTGLWVSAQVRLCDLAFIPATVVRRGDVGDSMFFISSGEVEVRLPHGGSVRLADGAFFGEMALLERQPRTASVATTKPTTLLVLYASDFYEIASHIPALAEAVEVEARRRREENLGRQPGDAGR